MNKVMVVGHPHSGYLDVEKLLNNCGVSQAQPSQNESISPIELGSILCKAHGVAPFKQATGEESIQQISVGAVWNGMVLDLFRGNLDQPLWGWSDPEAIHFLEYWKEIDPQLIFILVYNHPRTALSLDPNATYDLTSAILEQRIAKWQNYNAALLHFFHRNKDRSLLVHAQQVSTSAKKYVQQVRKYIRNTQSVYADMLLTYPDVGDSEHEMINEEGNTAGILPKEKEYWLQTVENDHEDSLKQFLAGEITEHYPKVGQLYEEIQAVASLPAEDNGKGLNSLAAWRTMSEMFARFQNLQNRSLEQQKQINELKGKVDELCIEVEKKDKQLQQAKQKSVSTKDLHEENELLLLQLHQVQEELEKYFLEKTKNKVRKKPLYTGAEKRLKEELPYKIGAAMIERSRKVWLLPFLPFSLLLLAWKHRQQQLGSPQNLPPLKEYNDYPKAERAQSHLSYRLGVALLKHIRTPWGWFLMPVALLKANRDFRNYRKEQGR